MRLRFFCVLPAVLSLLSASGLATRPQTTASHPAKDVAWRGRLAKNQTLEVKGVNGSVRALLASGAEAEVVAEKRARRSDPESVRIDVVSHEGGVTICAVYPATDGEPNVCAPGSGGHMKVNNNEVRVDFTVYVPPDVPFVARTVNGDVSGESLKGHVEGYTVNGSVRLTTTGYAQAETVNGSITASLGQGDWSDTREFRTVNGGITLDLPSDLSTLVRAETVNGQISSDFPMTVTGRFSPRRLRATIGQTDATTQRELALETVNGSIHLRRLQ